MRKVFAVWVFLAWGAGLLAQVKYSNEFMHIGVDARSFGMGGAGVASVTGAPAGYWNPAGLTGLDHRLDATLMHAEYFAGLAKYDYGAVAYAIDNQSTAALSLIRLGVDDIPNTLELVDANGNMRYDRITAFSASDVGVLLSYARQLHVDGLSAGASAKIIHRRTGEFATAWGFGLDAALKWVIDRWTLAAVARDVTTTFNAWSFQTDRLEEVFLITGNEIPVNSLEITLPRLILGAACSFTLNEQMQLNTEANLHFTLDGKRPVLLSLGFTGLDPYLGAEWVYKKWLSVRMGAGSFQWVPGLEGEQELMLQPAIGLGLVFKGVRIDYALTDPGDLAVSQYSNMLSLRYGFGQ